MKRIRYQLQYQGKEGTTTQHIVVEAEDLNLGFVKAAIEALVIVNAELNSGRCDNGGYAEIVSLTFWQVED